jgi:hypothetical protein
MYAWKKGTQMKSTFFKFMSRFIFSYQENNLTMGPIVLPPKIQYLGVVPAAVIGVSCRVRYLHVLFSYIIFCWHPGGALADIIRIFPVIRFVNTCLHMNFMNEVMKRTQKEIECLFDLCDFTHLCFYQQQIVVHAVLLYT